MPGPGGGDDVVEFRVSGFPAEFSERLVCGGHELGWVAGATTFLSDVGRVEPNRPLPVFVTSVTVPP